MKRLWRILLIGFAGFVALVIAVWLNFRPSDPLFRGQPESYWIEHLKYNDEEQVKQWRGFGPDGVHVLVRALDGANRPKDRFYRKFYRGAIRVFHGRVARILPEPRRDVTRITRMKVVDLLSRLSKDAKPAIPAMTRALNDEDSSVRQLAIMFFTQGEDENCLLNQLEAGTKKDLLPKFIQAAQDNSWWLRNNAIVALRYYPEQADVVAPILIKALKDPVSKVGQLAADALKRVDPAAAAKAGVN